MYHHELKPYARKVIENYPELKEEINNIVYKTFTETTGDMGNLIFACNCAYDKIERLKKKNKEKNTVVVEAYMHYAPDGRLQSLIKHDESDSSLHLRIPVSVEQIENFRKEKIKITIEKI